jgi:hypothetical protein
LVNVEGIVPFINRRRGGFILFAILGCAPVLCDLAGAIRRKPLRWSIQGAMITALAVTLLVGWNRWIGITLPTHEPNDTVPKLCRWVEQNTPRDAIFLAPPGEGKFRLLSRRAVVVDFKCVPQLAGELREWQQRLVDVTGVSDLGALPHGFDKLPGALNERFERQDADSLLAVAHKYGARYIVRARPLGPAMAAKLVDTGGQGYFLYDLQR